MPVTVVSGVPGVGASQVCEGARKALGEGYELLNFGDVMLEEAIAREGVTSRDDLRELSLRETRLLQRRAGEFVAERARETHVLLNTHVAVDTANGYVPGLPGPVLDDLAPEQFVLVEADAETVLDRREDDTYRKYGTEGLRRISFEQDLNRAAAINNAMAFGAPIQLIENTGSLEEAVATLVEMVETAPR